MVFRIRRNRFECGRKSGWKKMAKKADEQIGNQFVKQFGNNAENRSKHPL